MATVTMMQTKTIILVKAKTTVRRAIPKALRPRKALLRITTSPTPSTSLPVTNRTLVARAKAQRQNRTVIAKETAQILANPRAITMTITVLLMQTNLIAHKRLITSPLRTMMRLRKAIPQVQLNPSPLLVLSGNHKVCARTTRCQQPIVKLYARSTLT